MDRIATIICGVIWFLVAVVCILKPNYTWYLECGWKYKNAEPTNFALLLHRICGIIMIIIGIVFIVTN